MGIIIKGEIKEFSQNFVPIEFQLNQSDQHFSGNRKEKLPGYRRLTVDEIQILEQNHNYAEDWQNIQVAKDFTPHRIRFCEFYGLVRIGMLTDSYLENRDLRLPVGLYRSTIISCDIGDNVVINNVHYLAHFIIQPECILLNIDEMVTTNHAKFGEGIIKAGETEADRFWLGVGNENGERQIVPFSSILPADAFIWAKFRADSALQKSLEQLVDAQSDSRLGCYGSVGTQTVIKHCRALKDVKIGANAYLQGVDKLKNATVHSSLAEPTVIDSGIEIENAIIGYANKILCGTKALGVITGTNCQLKYGARVMDTFLGDNSTISCCEILSNLLFPFHEQHHNNSFLIATTIQGQSNIAAGATIGSNHNSRAADGEILARRGFWPGLCTSFKHNCKFAPFTLVTKGDYPYEMNITLPFSLLSLKNNSTQLQILPAYWFQYNMYALARNSWKFKVRDKRKIKRQNIEFDYLAPDTAEEMLSALDELRWAVGMAAFTDKPPDNEQARQMGKKLLDANYPIIRTLPITLSNQVNRGHAVILKVQEAYDTYYEMLLFYCLRTIIENLDERKIALPELLDKIPAKADRKWWNIGGQIMADSDLQEILQKIRSGEIKDWESVHRAYDEKWIIYPTQKLSHALQTLEMLIEIPASELKSGKWRSLFLNAADIQDQIAKRVRESREKDFIDPFLLTMFDSPDEMKAVIGEIDDVSFVQEMDERAVSFRKKVESGVAKWLF